MRTVGFGKELAEWVSEAMNQATLLAEFWIISALLKAIRALHTQSIDIRLEEDWK
jgi:hypothetical protein